MADGLRDIAVDLLTVDPVNPRPAAGDVDDLAASIRDIGIVNPLIVRPAIDGGFGVLSGQRRLKAATQAGHTQVPCLVRACTDDTTALQIATAENVGRRAMDPIAEARAFRRLIDELGITQTELGARLGVSDFTVSTRLQLLDLPADLQVKVADGSLSASRAYRDHIKATRPRTGRNLPRQPRTMKAGGLTLPSSVVSRVRLTAHERGEDVDRLVARALRRELAWPSCVKCETAPALTGIGRGTHCGTCRNGGRRG